MINKRQAIKLVKNIGKLSVEAEIISKIDNPYLTDSLINKFNTFVLEMNKAIESNLKTLHSNHRD